VIIVLKNLKDLKAEVSFAATHVNPQQEEIQVLMMSKENVGLAAKNLKQINMGELNVVLKVVRGVGYDKTYCVTVPNYGCFSLTTGVIVSNCRYALQPMIRNQSSILDVL
jgi:hypothetical protein